MGPAGDHDIRLAPANQHHGLADCLRAGGTGRQAASGRPSGPRQHRHMGGRHVGFLLELVGRFHPREGDGRAFRPGHGLLLRVPAGENAGEERIVVEGALARAEIDAHARAVDAIGRVRGLHLDARLPAGLHRRPGRKPRASTRRFVQLRPAQMRPEIVVLDLGVEGCGKGGGVEDRGAIDAAPAGKDRGPEGFHVMVQRADDAQPRNDDSLFCLGRSHLLHPGMLEQWKDGIMGGAPHLSSIPTFQYSIIPSFQRMKISCKP